MSSPYLAARGRGGQRDRDGERGRGGRDRRRGRGRQKDVDKESTMDGNAQVREAGEGGVGWEQIVNKYLYVNRFVADSPRGYGPNNSCMTARNLEKNEVLFKRTSLLNYISRFMETLATKLYDFLVNADEAVS